MGALELYPVDLRALREVEEIGVGGEDEHLKLLRVFGEYRKGRLLPERYWFEFCIGKGRANEKFRADHKAQLSWVH